MRVLFVMRYPGYLRYFGSTVKLLAERGHKVILAFDTLKKQPEGLKALEPSVGSIEVRGKWPSRKDVWKPLARRVRGLMDYVRYLHPRFKSARYLRDRMITKLPQTFAFLARVDSLPPWLVGLALRCLSACEAAIPPAKTVRKFVKSVNPDVVLVTPLVNPASTQMELMKVCEALGIQTCACIASWDHLTTKGLIRTQPDLVTVWNGTQKREAVELHGIPPSRIVVTGAQPFDDWFGREVGTGYAEFCRTVGLDPHRRFVLFVGSTASISSPDAEVGFVRQWAAALRASGDANLQEIGILVRPHPYNAGHWRQADLSDLGNVAIWPRNGANPVDAGDRADYFASLYHAAAVVGINTSAMIEAAIVGRPVHTILAPEFKDTQSGTVHFHYLLPEHGGFARVSVTLEQHIGQLAEALTNGDAMSAATSRFVDSFVRPRGRDTPGTPVLVDAVEALSQTARPRRRRMRVVLRPVTALLWILACILSVRDAR